MLVTGEESDGADDGRRRLSERQISVGSESPSDVDVLLEEPVESDSLVSFNIEGFTSVIFVLA